ncbi:cyclohexanecarboxyl-CoA dehydrogenase [Paracoccus sp. YIM 132242]|uniref:Cyclohexanecarboxyl-CoA dehydrogenase n=1 Tax=Paracoccus lichenicola TaxID=2665644 RepID=A0A6L6HTR8_9RHOB|nr:acyl-CoA dehydrogenase family protein [Paracoccus lichenicola]MTE01662.1 cyclohexanecarboxyl-CoA dehydrogenase [Paracoccus lichenicola]
MDFALTEEQVLMQDSLKSFALNELLPKYAHWDRTGQFPAELWPKLGEMGAFALRVPEEHGGGAYSYLDAGLTIEQIAKGDFNLCYGILNACFCGDILSRFASPALCETWLRPLAAGDIAMCVCLTEPHCGSDAASIRTCAVRDGDDYVITGEKSSVTLLMAGSAAVLFAKTDPDKGARGVSAFLVPLDGPGLSKTRYADMGARGIVRGSLFLDNVRVPATSMIGPENAGFSQVMATFDYTRALIGLMCLGAAEQTLEETVGYVKQRQAFGQPVSKNQGVSFPLAEAKARLEMLRWLCYRTLWLRDAGLPHTAEAAMCKAEGPALCADVIRDCMVLHGHYGYTQDYPVEQRYRDVLGQIIADGTPQIMKMIIARHMLGREFA